MMRFVLVALLALTCARSKGQVLISILLGDKLNSGKVEFGLEGGLNMSTLGGVNPSSSLRVFNLGFYFDIKLKDPSWMLHTGVLVKSAMGAEGISVYSLNDPDLDDAFSNGSVIRKIRYFNVPFMIKHKWKNNVFAEIGPMFGLRNKATDEFVATVNKKNDLRYTLDVRDLYHPLDAGMMAGVGYRLMGGNGMNLGARYYYGVVDIAIDDSSPDQFNRSFYLYIDIPIGAGKKPDKEKK